MQIGFQDGKDFRLRQDVVRNHEERPLSWAMKRTFQTHPCINESFGNWFDITHFRRGCATQLYEEELTLI